MMSLVDTFAVRGSYHTHEILPSPTQNGKQNSVIVLLTGYVLPLTYLRTTYLVSESRVFVLVLFGVKVSPLKSH